MLTKNKRVSEMNFLLLQISVTKVHHFPTLISSLFSATVPALNKYLDFSGKKKVLIYVALLKFPSDSPT